MTIGKIFFEEEIDNKDTVEIKGDDFHYLSKVLRVKRGEHIFLIDRKHYYLSKVVELAKEYITVQIIEKRVINKVDFKINLYFGLLKADKNDFVIKYATQLAAYSIHPLVMKRTVIKLSPDEREKRAERYRRIVRDAARDAFLGFAPEVNDIEDLFNKRFDNEGAKILFYEGENLNSLEEIKTEIQKNHSVSILFGPEGGIEKDELKLLLENGFCPVSLGERMVKAETAIMAALSIISFMKKGRLL